VVDGARFTRQQLDKWYFSTIKRLDSRAYSPGAHCRFCSRGPTCEAKTAVLSQAASSLTSLIWQDLPESIPERADAFIKIFDRIKLVQGWSDNIRDLVKVEVAGNGGSMASSDGRELRIVEQSQRQIDFEAAWDTLRHVIPDGKRSQCFSVHKGAVEEVIKSSAGRGNKGKAVKKVMEKLESSGAIKTKTIHRLEVKQNGSPRAAIASDDRAEEAAICGSNR
jgi:hypothetical protein